MFVEQPLASPGSAKYLCKQTQFIGIGKQDGDKSSLFLSNKIFCANCNAVQIILLCRLV